MAKFKYRMESVLKVKQKLEDQARGEFGIAQRKLNEELAKMEELESYRESLFEEGALLRCSSINVLDLRNNALAMDLAKESIQKQKVQIAVAQKSLDAANRNLQIAMQERKMQEKLKEKAFEVFKQEIARQEAKEVDELTSYRYQG